MTELPPEGEPQLSNQEKAKIMDSYEAAVAELLSAQEAVKAAQAARYEALRNNQKPPLEKVELIERLSTARQHVASFKQYGLDYFGAGRPYIPEQDLVQRDPSAEQDSAQKVLNEEEEALRRVIETNDERPDAEPNQ